MTAAPESPCRKQCQLDPGTRHCTGCYRSLEEIGQWSRLSPEARSRIIAELPARARRLGFGSGLSSG